MRVRALLAAAVAAVGLATSAQGSNVINFDPDGGGPDGTVKVITFDYNVSDSLNLGFIGQTNGWDLLFHASLNSLNDENGKILGIGLNTGAYEITTVLRVGVVQTVPTPNLEFKKAKVQTVNFLEFWYDATPDANNLAGTGFNDGTRILSATISRLQGNFDLDLDGSGNPVTTTFDKFGTDNYGIQSVTGQGAVTLNASVNFVDTSFFPDGLNKIKVVIANASDILPFNQVNPSAQFASLPNAGGFVNANMGAINGISGPDVQVQSDANAAFTIPLPSAAWAGMALLGLLGAARIRKVMR